MKLSRLGIFAALVLALGLTVAPSAQASFHLIQIREVYAGSALDPEAEYVELQMWAGGQNLVGGHVLRTFGPNGELIGASTFAADVPNGANQSTLVLATPTAALQFGIVADAPLASGFQPGGGAICWESIDCVSWGNFTGNVASITGTPAAAIPSGMALRRSIAAGCSTLLESADDTNNSAADFALTAPAPRPNAVAPSEKPCTSSEAPPPNTGGRPQTTLVAKPARRTHDRTPTFRFRSNRKGSFECRLDGARFRKCRSPYTTRKLAFGSHRFSVRARDASGLVDRSPASYSFKVLR